jgi:alkyl sulfatase BDS1-like metallo-beta-lactamase superfamily hydrolase
MELLDYTLPYTSYSKDVEMPPAPLEVTLDRHELDNLAVSLTPCPDFQSAVTAGKIKVDPAGAAQQVATIFDMLDVFPANFNIVTPRQEQDSQ